MRQNGFTLIELLVVVAIITILTVVLGFEFAGWVARYKVESQIKTMQVDLMTARQRAMEKKSQSTNTQYVVQLPALNGTGYIICEDSNGNNICDAAEKTTSVSQALSKSGLRYPITWNLPGGAGGQIVMSMRGMVRRALGAGTSTDIIDLDNTAPVNIWLLNPDTMAVYGPTTANPTLNEVDYDCISISTTRIDLGKYDGVVTCNVK